VKAFGQLLKGDWVTDGPRALHRFSWNYTEKRWAASVLFPKNALLSERFFDNHDITPNPISPEDGMIFFR
jgi:hypothetical protein